MSALLTAVLASSLLTNGKNICCTFQRALVGAFSAATLAGSLTLTGCNSAQHSTSGSVSMGAVSQSQIGEVLLEGPSTNLDGIAVVGGKTVKLRWSPIPDLQTINSTARTRGDWELAISAMLLAVELASPNERESSWIMVASTIQEAPAGVTIALAEMIHKWIVASETAHGLDAGSSIALQAIQERAQRHLFSAQRNYSAAQGVWNDDEALIAMALLDGLFGASLNRNGAGDHELMLSWERVQADCRGDLWSEQIAQVCRTFDQSKLCGSEAVARSFQRASNANLLYAQMGSVSTCVPREFTVEGDSKWGSRSGSATHSNGGAR